jgi:putative membrane protein
MFAAAAVLLIAFTSPFRALSSAHSLARIFHHMLLVAVAAPLIAWALPATLRSSPLQLAAVAQAVAPWFWHAPAPYRAALSDPLVYWTMELSLLATAVLFWSALKVRRDDFVPVMGVLGGAVLTFAPELLYDPHLRAPLAFGLTPLNDQRVAGLLIGAPGAAPYAAAALAIVARLLIRRPEAPSWRG